MYNLVYNKADNTEHLVLLSLYDETIPKRIGESDLPLATTKTMSGIGGMNGRRVGGPHICPTVVTINGYELLGII